MLEWDYPKILRKFYHTKDEINSKLSQKSDILHVHGNISNDGKLNSANSIVVTDAQKNITVVNTISKDKIGDFSHTHDKEDITDFNHSHSKSDITDFSHTHNRNEITNFNHSHSKSDITDFSHTHNKNEINDFSHTHDKEDITDFNHSHSKSDITDFSHTHNKNEITNFNHTHIKSELTDLYNYELNLSNFNPNIGKSQSTTLTVKVTTQNNLPVANHNVTVYKNGSSYDTGNTNSNGIFTTTFTPTKEGITSFRVNNQIVQCNSIYDTGWLDLEPYSVLWVKTNAKPQIRRVGNTVRIRGTVKSKTTFPLLSYDDFVNVCMLPDQRFYPSMDESFVVQSSKVQRALLKSKNEGALVVSRFSDTKNDGSYTIPNNLGLTLNCSYFVE